MQKLIANINEIINLLTLCNQDLQANWLRQKSAVLMNSSTGQEKETLKEIKKSIAGMGSLSDMYLVPQQTSGLSKSQANKKLHELIKELDIEIHLLLR